MLIEFLCLLPLTIPALVIVVGISNVYSWVTYLLGDSPLVLTFVYVVFVLPYAYRALDAALSSIDVATLAEAARSLGAGWFTVIVRIIMPNITGGILGAAFIAVALVLGEYVARLAAALRHPAGGDGGASTAATGPPPWPRRSRRWSSCPRCCSASPSSAVTGTSKEPPHDRSRSSPSSCPT